MQKVTVEKWVQENEGQLHYPTKRVADGNAEFMAWSVSTLELEYRPGLYATAIIKRDDGSIENVDCTLIKFVS